MAAYTQDTRPLRVSTALGKDVLLLARFNGQEGVSKPFHYELDMFSTKNNIAAKDLLRTAATVTLSQKSGGDRFISGLVRRFVQLGTMGDLTAYRAEVVPWLWFLSLTRDCRIFQNKSVLDIIEQVFKDLGYSDFENRCTRTYAKRDYCVQYRESALNFVSRLMEEEGIFYFFKHTDGKHVMVLADNNSAVLPCPGMSTARVVPEAMVAEDAVTHVQFEHNVHIGKVTYAEYDYLQPSHNLRSSISGTGKEEVYDYLPVGYSKLEDGDRYARIQLEHEESLHEMIRAKTTCGFLQSGFRVDLKDHYRSDVNKTWMVTEVNHSGDAGDYRSAGPVLAYKNEIVAIPHSVPFRPAQHAEKPLVHGSQTAVVVGQQGEEIWVDSHGRVKVQFHWDREGKKNESSSCWVRVSSAWAGKGWGGISIPRIGQEVVVDFLEGDPDRPIIVGRVYNAEQTPPYTLPANGTQSGIKSRSSKSGGTDNFNEIRLEDKKGSELFFIQAEKDKEVNVKHDRTETVGNDEKITIEGNRTEEVKKNEKITIVENREEEVKKDEKIKIGGSRTEEVVKDETMKVKGKRDHDVTGDDSLSITGNHKITVKQDHKLDVTKNIDVAAKIKITIQANAGIELKVGASTLKITPGSIELKSPVIKLEGQGMVEIKAPMVMGKATGMLQLKGPMTMVNGDGMLMLKGGLTMIN